MRSATKKHTGKDKPYLAWIHTQQCVAFERRLIVTGLLDISPCVGRITAHHAGPHGLSQRADDWTALPLCDAHHQHGPHSVHKLGKLFWAFHGLDRFGLIAALNLAYQLERSAA
jgi:hypothetical protein